MLYFVLFPDGRVKGYLDSDLAARCVAGDGGQLVPVAIAQPAAAAAPAPEILPVAAAPAAPAPASEAAEAPAAAPDPAPAPQVCPTCHRPL